MRAMTTDSQTTNSQQLQKCLLKLSCMGMYKTYIKTEFEDRGIYDNVFKCIII